MNVVKVTVWPQDCMTGGSKRWPVIGTHVLVGVGCELRMCPRETQIESTRMICNVS